MVLNKSLVRIHQNILLDIYCSHFHKHSFFISVVRRSLSFQSNLRNHILFYIFLLDFFIFCAWGNSWLLKNILTILCFPADTGRKLDVHKTFRRRPERLLNVLCTFNLRSVSTGVAVQFFFVQRININKMVSCTKTSLRKLFLKHRYFLI